MNSMLAFLLFFFESLIDVSDGISVCCSVVEIPSDSSLDFSVQVLSKHKLLSVPVYDVDAPKDSSWIDRYIGMVEFDGIVAFVRFVAFVSDFSSSQIIIL